MLVSLRVTLSYVSTRPPRAPLVVDDSAVVRQVLLAIFNDTPDIHVIGAASDPIFWRDVFLNNREAVLEMLQRLTEDLSALQRAIRRGEGDFLVERFARAREIRRSVIDAKQA